MSAAATLTAARMALTARLSRGLAHDLNNALAAVVGQLELMSLRATGTEAERVSELIDVVVGAAATTRRLQEALSAGDAAGPPVHIDPVDAAERALERADRLFSEEVTVELDAGLHLPEISARKVELELALVALLANACDAVGSRGHVRLEVRATDSGVGFRVHDDGPGVAEPERIWTPGFSTRTGGQGLGLALVAGVAEDHGGEARLLPNAAGATFELEIPAAG